MRSQYTFTSLHKQLFIDTSAQKAWLKLKQPLTTKALATLVVQLTVTQDPEFNSTWQLYGNIIYPTWLTQACVCLMLDFIWLTSQYN